MIQLDGQRLAAVLQAFLPRATLRDHRLLTGGYSNTNYALTTDAGDFVLRIHARSPDLARKEQAVYRLLSGVVPMAELMGTQAPNAALPYACSLLRFVPGRSLEQLLVRADRDELDRAGQTVGRALALMSGHRFLRAGDLVADNDDELRVEPWPALDFNRWCLFESPAGRRLGPLRDELWQLLQARSFDDPSPPQLVHGDFNPTNLLFDETGELVAVLDWEFAHAGSLYMDLGNLFRERNGTTLPDDFTTALDIALQELDVSLPLDAFDRALLVDLSSALDFLSSPDERPERHAAAIAQVRSTTLRLTR